MTVRKKPSSSPSISDILEASPELKFVKGVISTLPTEDIMENDTPGNGEQAPGSDSATTATKKTPKKKPAPAAAKKKVAVKKKAAPAAKKKAAPAGDMVKLAELAKAEKLKPSAARRKLRDAKFKKTGQWAWPKGDPAIAKVKAILKSAE